jgi:hypothetical protein
MDIYINSSSTTLKVLDLLYQFDNKTDPHGLFFFLDKIQDFLKYHGKYLVKFCTVKSRKNDHGLSFWKKLRFHLKNHGLLLEKSNNLTTYTVFMFL